MKLIAFAKSMSTLFEVFSGCHEVRKRSVPIDDSMSILLATAITFKILFAFIKVAEQTTKNESWEYLHD